MIIIGLSLAMCIQEKYVKFNTALDHITFFFFNREQKFSKYVKLQV